MKKYSGLFAFLLLLLPLVVSCNGAQKKSAEKTVESFFAALKKEDTLQMAKFYPEYDSIGGYYKSNKIEILKTEVLDNEQIKVTVKNYFTNGFGTKFNQTISMFVKPGKSENQYKIADSEGLMGFKELVEYKFAVNTGCIPAVNKLTDLAIAKKLKEADKLRISIGKKMLEDLQKKVVISDWKWNYGYVNTYADGSGKVTNNSSFTFPYLKFVISFVNEAGEELAEDDGYLCYDDFAPGATFNFATFSSNIGGASIAYIAVDFDSDMILDEVAKGKYTGKEYAEFLKSKH